MKSQAKNPCALGVLHESYGFRHEDDLVSEIIDTFVDTRSDSWHWYREIKFSNGIADLAAVKFSGQLEELSKLSLIPPRWAYSLHSLPVDIRLSVDDIASHSGCSASTAIEMINVFVSAGYLSRQEPSLRLWTKNRSPGVFAERIVAIEAKLRDWKRALYQATRYCDFATESWVVLDERNCQSADSNFNEFEDRGIGLAVLSRGGSFSILVDARSRPPRSLHRFWEVNAMLAQLQPSSHKVLSSVGVG